MSKIPSGKERQKLVPTRVEGYQIRPVNGFGVSITTDDHFIVEPFFDLPPLPNDFYGPHELVTIQRQIWGGYSLNRQQAKTLIDMLSKALADIPEQNNETNS